MVSGTARPGPDSPAPPSTTRESSSRKNGFPSAFSRMTSATRSDTASARRTDRTTRRLSSRERGGSATWVT